MVLISVLINHRGDWKALEQSLLSVERQRSRFPITLEIIVLSPTNDIQDLLIERYPNEWYNNVSLVISDKSETWLDKLKYANGDWVAIIFSGEVWRHDKIESQLDYLLKEGSKTLVHQNKDPMTLMGDKLTMMRFFKTMDWSLAEDIHN